jgi:hypothetical protein
MIPFQSNTLTAILDRGGPVNCPDDLRIAKRMVWFKSPDEAIEDPELFLAAHVMTYGTLYDIATTLNYHSEADFEAALNRPLAGIFDRRSWNYWNLRYHHDPVPPLPRRRIPGFESVSNDRVATGGSDE